MTTEWVDADTGEEVAVVEEIQPKKRGRPPKDTRPIEQVREDLGEEYVSPTRSATEEPPAYSQEELNKMSLAEAAHAIFEGDEVDPKFNPGYVLNEEGVPYLPPGGTSEVIRSGLNDRRTLVDKLIAVMAAVDAVEKKGQNTSMNYGYQRATDVFNAVRPEFIKQGLLFTTSVYKTTTTMIERPNKPPNVLVEIEANFRVTDGREVLEFSGAGAGTDSSGDKSVYKAITGAMKYGIRQLLMLPDENDPEKSRPGEREDSEGVQGPSNGPVVFTTANPSAVSGVLQGGRQQVATSAQIESIRNSARGLNLSPYQLVAYIHTVLGDGPADSSNPGEIISWLSNQSFGDVGRVAHALQEAAQSDGGT